jgi:hypothetical protein
MCISRFYDDNTRKWQSMDIEIQRHVVRSIAAFLDSISGDTIHHPLVKVFKDIHILDFV